MNHMNHHDQTMQEHTLKELKVLYVEDDQATAEELSQFLKRRVGKVYVARDGQQGLELFEENKPDIIIADLFLPKIGGIEMVKAIRSKGFETPVIITSAVSDSNVILSAVDAGILKYLLKPIRTTELLRELGGNRRKNGRQQCSLPGIFFSQQKRSGKPDQKRIFCHAESLNRERPQGCDCFHLSWHSGNLLHRGDDSL